MCFFQGKANFAFFSAKIAFLSLNFELFSVPRQKKQTFPKNQKRINILFLCAFQTKTAPKSSIKHGAFSARDSVIFQKIRQQKSAADCVAKKFSAKERAQYGTFRKKYTVFFPDETVSSIEKRRAQAKISARFSPPTA